MPDHELSVMELWEIAQRHAAEALASARDWEARVREELGEEGYEEKYAYNSFASPEFGVLVAETAVSGAAPPLVPADSNPPLTRILWTLPAVEHYILDRNLLHRGDEVMSLKALGLVMGKSLDWMLEAEKRGLRMMRDALRAEGIEQDSLS